jgi:hypothetical protein
VNISPALQRTISRSTLQLQKYSPQILTAVGIGGLIAAGVLAARQTLKLEETLDNAKARLEQIDVVENAEGVELKSERTKAVAKNIFDLAKLYSIPVSLGAASIVAILVGHNILHKRNLALIGAYKGLEQAFAEYRKRVIEEHGEEADEKYRFGVRETTEVGENGKKVKTKSVEPNLDYIFSFDPTNENWSGRNDDNHFFLQRFQNIFNDRLQAKGHVFLQDVTRALGMPDSKVGAVTGWCYKKGTGDDYVDFKMIDLQNDPENPRILLDFNVDGVILDLI